MPNIGDIVHSKDRGLKSKQSYIWVACAKCGKEHWVESRKGKPFYDICFDCSRPKKKVWELITTEPYLGEIRRSDQIEGYAKCKTRYIWCKCPSCGYEKWRQLVSVGKYNQCRKCMHKGKIKEKSGTWKGGIRVHGEYIMVKLYPNDPFFEMADCSGYVFEHRLVMAKELGRSLYAWEEVHHRDSIKTHNIPENLFVTDAKNHNKLVEHVLVYQEKEIKDLKSRVTLLESENTLYKMDMSEFI